MSCVYIIQADNGEVKVGISGSPYARLSQVVRDYSAPRGFSDAYLVAVLPTPAAEMIESIVLDLLRPHATGGEWFRVSALYALRALLCAAEGLADGPVLMEGPAQPRVPVSALRGLLA